MEINPEHIAGIPLYIVTGSPRSGSSMLQFFLDAHPDTVVPVEFPFIALYAPVFERRINWSEKDIDEYLFYLRKKLKFGFWQIGRWNIDFEILRRQLIGAAARGLDYSMACRLTIASFRSVFPKNKPKILLLKEPAYSMETRRLQKIFPEVKFIHLHRDPRGQVCSIIRMPFGSRLITANAYQWKKVQKRLLHESTRDSGRFFRIPYETLVSDPEGTLRSLCGFLNIGYNPCMQRYTDRLDEIKQQYGFNDPEILRMADSSFGAPDSVIAEAWKDDLRPAEVRVIEAGCRKTMVQLGYALSAQPGLWSRLRYIPVILHSALQSFIGVVLKIFPFRWRLKIMFLPSLFETTYGKLFGRRHQNPTSKK